MMQSSEESRATALHWKADLGLCAVSTDGEVWEEFGSVYERCFPTVLWYTISRVSDPVLAEELVAETFERALVAWPSFRRESTACRWILGIARHVIAAHWKEAARRPLRLEGPVGDAHPADEPTPEEHVQQRDELEQLQRAMAHLTDQERDLVLLRYAADLPFREIADALSAQEGTVRVRIHRVLRRLRSLLDLKD